MSIVGVANPATYVAKSGPYETRNDDVVINLARIYWPWGGSILPATWNGMGTVGDASGHKFVESYLGPIGLRDRIRFDIGLQTATVADSPCKLDIPPATSCGVPITVGGGSGSSQYVMTIGTEVKTLTANFEAYTIPDAMSITSATGGSALATTNGPVSGFNAYSFRFDPQALGTTQLIARVTGNSNTDTRWSLCIDCNDAVSSPCPTVLPKRTVTIGLSYQGFQYTCTGGPVQIDSKAVGSLTVQSPIQTSLSPTSANEYHQLTASNAGCVCTQTTGCLLAPDPAPKLSFSYVDGKGVNQYFEVPLSKSVNFYIQ